MWVEWYIGVLGELGITSKPMYVHGKRLGPLTFRPNRSFSKVFLLQRQPCIQCNAKTTGYMYRNTTVIVSKSRTTSSVWKVVWVGEMVVRLLRTTCREA